jgi:hypothetical protein
VYGRKPRCCAVRPVEGHQSGGSQHGFILCFRISQQVARTAGFAVRVFSPRHGAIKFVRAGRRAFSVGAGEKQVAQSLCFSNSAAFDSRYFIYR